MNRLSAIACALALCGCVTVTKRPVVEVNVVPVPPPVTTLEVEEPVLPAAEHFTSSAEFGDVTNSRAQVVQAEPIIRPRTFRNLGADRVSRLGQSDYAFFEAFPADGSGVPGVCSTTAPTGVKGEVLTFTRASNATCTKTAAGGLATTGIANGDLVVLSSNQPRVEYDANGTLGLLVESSRTNSLLRSEEFNNAAWSTTSTGVAVPTITANFAVAPDGTTTAERLEIPAVTGAQFSLIFQSVTLTSPSTSSLFVKGNGTSGTVCFTLGTASSDNVLCSYNSTTWTRCINANKTPAGSQPVYIGNYGTVGGACGAASAQDILVWGGQVETSGAPYATSYIPTVAATATRVAEVPSFGPSTFGITTNKASVAASFQRTTGTQQAVPILLQNVFEFIYTSTSSVYHYPAGSFFGTLAMPGSGVVRFASGADGATRTNCINSSCESTAVVSTNFSGSPWTLVLGSEAGAKYIDTIISRICVDPDPTRCR